MRKANRKTAPALIAAREEFEASALSARWDEYLTLGVLPDRAERRRIMSKFGYSTWEDLREGYDEIPTSERSETLLGYAEQMADLGLFDAENAGETPDWVFDYPND
jgi:hypothetical protein